MKNQKFERMERIIGILLAFFFVVSLSVASAGSSSSASSSQKPDMKSFNHNYNEPNRFVLDGIRKNKDVHITYSTTSLSQEIIRLKGTASSVVF